MVVLGDGGDVVVGEIADEEAVEETEPNGVHILARNAQCYLPGRFR